MSGGAIPAVRLSAILAADAAGYSRLMAIDDRLTVELLDAGREVFRDACAEHDGRIVDMAGDSVLLAFGSAASALRCALAVQQRLVATAAATAIAQARTVADSAWPPVRAYGLAEAETHSARTRGDVEAALRFTRLQLVIARACERSEGPELANVVDAELAAGQAEQAAATGVALVESLAGRRDEMQLAFARMNLSAALLALSHHERARLELMAGWAQARQFDLQAPYADYLVLLAALEGRFDAAARLTAYADAGNAVSGERQSNEAAAHTRAVRLARATLGDGAFDRLYAEGASLRDADIEGLAFGANDAR